MDNNVTRLARSELLLHALAIAEEYGGNLTLRQLYYQLVARGHSPNAQEDYKRLGSALTDARLGGVFPMNWLIDRTRTVHRGRSYGGNWSVGYALQATSKEIDSAPYRWLWAPKWYRQYYHVSVWVEKEALAGVFEGPCEELGVSWFACKGYPSISSLWDWMGQVQQAFQEGRHHECVVLYFGDHDPDGWQIPRSAMDTVRCLQEQAPDMPHVNLKRIALSMDQIEEHDAVPFPAKMTSSRYARYVEEHGTTDAWELDALPPDTLDTMIRDSVLEFWDESVHQENTSQVNELREEMRVRMTTAWFEDGRHHE